MAKASQAAAEPSMEDILASIRRIISDEEDSGNEAEDASQASDLEDNPVEIEAADDMGDSAEMSQDDLDKLFDMDVSEDDDTTDITEVDDIDEMAAAMADAEAEAEEDDVLELTEELAVEEEAVIDDIDVMAGAVEGSDVAFVEEDLSEPEPAPAPQAAAREFPAASVDTSPVPDTDLPEVGEDGRLTSDTTGYAVHDALDNLSSMFVGSNAQTVEELIRDMLRPMLKAWLDQNLPGMVEEMVQKEIQRITRRR